ncbi:MAG TPA: hypothetical protein VK174_01755 [Chitinophagales bacterium]|nr:hypothetical protein [Chitinophagales bacterium]
MNIRNLILSAIAILCLSATLPTLKTITLKFPKRKHIQLKITGPEGWSIKAEKKGEDVYYSNLSDKLTESDIMFSVLFFKLNAYEQKTMVDDLGLESSPMLPAAYFLSNNPTASIETSKKSWDDSTFFYRDYNIEQVEGLSVHQKNMKAYCMYDKDLFVQIHLSKLKYTDSDSADMRSILNSLAK